MFADAVLTTKNCSIASPVTSVQALGVLLYEAILLFGLLFFVSAVVHTLWPQADATHRGLRLAMWIVLGLYFTVCWHKTGQTLAMKTWHVRLVGQTSQPIGWWRAMLRYCLAWWLLLPGYGVVVVADLTAMAAALALIVGFVVAWATRYLDPQQRGLHDWIAKTRMESVRITNDQSTDDGR
mgnify:CR=1 FL=1